MNPLRQAPDINQVSDQLPTPPSAGDVRTMQQLSEALTSWSLSAREQSTLVDFMREIHKRAMISAVSQKVEKTL